MSPKDDDDGAIYYITVQWKNSDKDSIIEFSKSQWREWKVIPPLDDHDDGAINKTDAFWEKIENSVW